MLLYEYKVLDFRKLALSSARNLSTQFTTTVDCARMCSRLAVASLAALMLASIARAQVTLNVIPGFSNRNCDPNGFKLSHTLNPDAANGGCERLSISPPGMTSSIKVLSCSTRCLCFATYLANRGTDQLCDADNSEIAHKEACLDVCTDDCSGEAWRDCSRASIAQVLWGEGPICGEPVPDWEYSCPTAGMSGAQLPDDVPGSDAGGAAHGDEENTGGSDGGASLATDGITYNVIPAAMNPTCDPDGVLMKAGHPLGQPANGDCVELGRGKAAYNALEIISCSSRCLCFTQYASMTPDGRCDGSMSLGHNVKEACLDECMADCNGIGCGETATLESSHTRLSLFGEGKICAAPLAEAEYSCPTTGMVRLDGPRDRGDTAGRAAGDDAQGGRKGDSGLALPIPAIAGIAVGVILLAVFAATAWWYRRAVPASKVKQSAPSPEV